MHWNGAVWGLYLDVLPRFGEKIGAYKSPTFVMPETMRTLTPGPLQFANPHSNSLG
jgi:hypothetical protein